MEAVNSGGVGPMTMTCKYALVKVPTERIRSAWPDILPFIQKVVDCAPDELTVEAILNRVLRKEEDLMTVISPDGEVVAAFTLSVRTMDTGKRQLCLPVLAADDFHLWMDDVFPQLGPIAEACGCYQVRAIGARPGFSKVFARYRKIVNVRHDISLEI